MHRRIIHCNGAFWYAGLQFLVVDPADLNFRMEAGVDTPKVGAKVADESEGSGGQQNPVSFLRALAIPGVITYSATLFFSKLVAYTFLYWLPYYVHHVPVGKYHKTVTARLYNK